MKNKEADIIGKEESLTVTITSEMVNDFAKLSGDLNPIHIDEEYAKQTIFGKRISHGMLVASLISNVIANKLPGPGTIYMSQDLSFRKPVFINDEVTAVVTVLEKKKEKPIYKLKTVCVNQNNEIVIDGESYVRYKK